MHASELAEQVPTVTRETTALEAARVIAEHRLGGLIVANDAGVPVAVVPGTQVLKLFVPRYVREDPSLAHVYDEAGADELCAALEDKTVAALFDSDEITTQSLPSVLPEDTLVEIAAVMVEAHSPLVVVRDRGGSYSGVITFARAMAAIAAAAARRQPTTDTADSDGPDA
ncbi:MAG: CBS domain-containing protein [Geodermatophilaceae bacterium]|nr:CBS domain-containing protein [Geodermatophilaceae bacterium]